MCAMLLRASVALWRSVWIKAKSTRTCRRVRVTLLAMITHFPWIAAEVGAQNSTDRHHSSAVCFRSAIRNIRLGHSHKALGKQ